MFTLVIPMPPALIKLATTAVHVPLASQEMVLSVRM